MTQEKAPAKPNSSDDADREKMVKKVAERVMQLWREDLRRQRERVGAKNGR